MARTPEVGIKRSAHVLVRLTPGELALLDRLRGNETRSHYARRALLAGAHIATDPGRPLAVVSDSSELEDRNATELPEQQWVPDPERDKALLNRLNLSHRHRRGDVVAIRNLGKGQQRKLYRCTDPDCPWTSE